ncbi:uncharacterized protein V1510DRAFT_430991 [Dipodascopsis tothii]|uniref:uncharacterized protein n=1 Tax=Dipodascopsis tothii TaxID=44089 RepID=UPI0034CD0DF2
MEDPIETTARARELLQAGDAPEALQTLASFEASDYVPLIETLAEAHLEVAGQEDDGSAHAEKAYELFERAVKAAEAGAKPAGSFEKYLYLGQLSGGREAAEWFKRGCNVLRADIAETSTTKGALSEEAKEARVRELKRRLCDALCSSVELWMTDLCMEDEAEATCDALVTEALMVDETHAEALTTLASVRVSQQRVPDARAALERAWALYADTDLTQVPDAAGHIAALMTLVRLCLETGLLEIGDSAARQILELDEQIAEAWYLLGMVGVERAATSEDPAPLTAALDAFNAGLEVVVTGADPSADPEIAGELKRQAAAVKARLDGREVADEGEDGWVDIMEGDGDVADDDDDMSE